MVAIVTGTGLGLETSSAFVLGSRGRVGSSGLGRAGDNVYVNAATGNLIVHQGQDEILIGRGPNALINRTYNSLGSYGALSSGADTDNWLYNSQRTARLIGTLNQAGSSVELTDWDGSVVVFNFVSANSYRATQNPYRDDTLNFDTTTSTWTWTDGKSRRVEKFWQMTGTNTSRIAESADADGNTITYTYDDPSTPGRLLKITTSNVAGQTGFTTFVYTGNNVTSIVTSYNDAVSGPVKTRTRVYYGYDGSNRLTSVKVDLSPDDNSITDGRIYETAYTYDGASKRVATISQTDGTLLSFTYDGSGRVQTFTQTVETGVTRMTSFAYSASSTTITDAAGLQTVLHYDGSGRLTRKDEPGAAVNDHPLVTTFSYNSNGYVTQMRRYASPAAIGSSSYLESIDYDVDDNGNIREEIDAERNVIRRTFGSNNELLSETRYSGLDSDGVLGGTEQLGGGMTTRYIYDDTYVDGGSGYMQTDDSGARYNGNNSADVWENHVRFVVSPEGRVTEYRYDANGFLIAEIDYANNLYSGLYTEKALSDWVSNPANHAGSVRADSVYNFRGNISLFTTYAATGTNGVGLTAEYSQTEYIYDPAGNLLKKITSGTNSVTATETYAYDGMGRVIRFTDAAGVGTWTTYADVQNRTIVTLANGLTRTSSYNRAGELIASSTAQANLNDENSANTNVATWTTNATLSSAETLDGATATQIVPASGQTTGDTYTTVPVVAGEALTWTISLKALGNSTTHALGLLGGATLWGSAGLTSARIVSGPGVIVRDPSLGGYIGIQQLSADDATRIEITRYFTQDENIQLHLYTQGTASPAAQGVIVSANSVVRSRYSTSEQAYSNAQFDINNWIYTGVNRTDAGTLGGGAPASRFSVQSSGLPAVVYNYLNINPGDTVTMSMSLKATDTGSTASLGILGNVSSIGAGYNALSTARIVTGPGTLTQEAGGLWNIVGLSTTQETRVEISRIFYLAEGSTVFLNPDRPAGTVAGHAIIAAAPSIIRSPGNQTSFKYDARGLLRIKLDPVGARQFYFYDRAGRKIGEVDQNGSVTEYRYDAADRLVATVAYSNALSTAHVSALYDSNGNPTSVDFATVRSQLGTAVADRDNDRWSWNIYDKAGRLTGTIDAAGAVQKFEYDGAARLVRTTRYFNTVDVTSYKTAIPTALTLPTADPARDRAVRSFFSNDGLHLATLDADGFLTEAVFDGAGRKVESIGYSAAATGNLATDTLAALRSSITSRPDYTSVLKPKEIHNYWIYDGRGLVVAAIDGEGNVTRYQYNARGSVLQEVRGRKIDIDLYLNFNAADRTAAHLEARYLIGPEVDTLDVTDFTYTLRGEVETRIRNLADNKTETTSYIYDRQGKLVSEMTSETVSAETRSTTNRYDAKGRLIGALSGIGSAALAALGASPTQAQIDNIYATYGTRYVYDAADRLIQMIAPAGSGSGGNRTVYYYDEDGQLRYEINALGEIVEHRYNAFSQKSETIVYGTAISTGALTGGFASTISGAVNAIANATKDSRIQFVYDNRGQLDKELGTYYSASNSDYIDYAYNSFGERVEILRYPLLDQTGQPLQTDKQTLIYNRRGLLTSDTRLLNGSSTGAIASSLAYDAFGRLFTQTSNALTQTYLYDRAGRREFQRDNYYNNGSIANDDSLEMKFKYDSRSNLIKSTDRTGRETKFEYDAFNRSVKTTTPESIVTTVKKNAYGQTIDIVIPGTYFPDGDGQERKTSYTYDKNGNLKTVSDGIALTTNDYDNADRLKETVQRFNSTTGNKTSFEYDAAGRVWKEIRDPGPGGLNLTTTYEYDAKGQQVKITDARNIITKIDYDLKGRQVGISRDDTGLALKTKYSYRNDGKVIEVIDAFGTSDARKVKYEYDSMGRLLFQRIDPDSGGLNLKTETVYDINNNVVAVIDARLNKTRFIYDKENRQVLLINAEREVVETGYDADGRVIWTRAYANKITQATLDSWGNQVTKVTDLPGLTADPARDQLLRTIYDKDGRKAWTIDAEGFATRFVYDGANNITKTIHFVAKAGVVTDSTTALALDSIFNLAGFAPSAAAVTTFRYDQANRLKETIDAMNFSEKYEYDDAGNRTALINKLNGRTEYRYDTLGRLTEERIKDIELNGVAVADFLKIKYEYDAVGNVKKQTEAPGRAEERVTEFEYDGANRVKVKKLPQVMVYNPDTGLSVLNASLQEHYDYDKRGNLLGVTDAAGYKTSHAYDRANRKISTISPIGQYVEWLYDGLGNVETERQWGTLLDLSVGAQPIATQLQSAEKRETQFVYDKAGRQTERKIESLYTGYWSGSAYVGTTGTISFRSTYDALGNLVKETDANNNSTYHYFDRNGRELAKLDQLNFLTTWTRDQDGNVEKETRYANSIGNGFDETSPVAALEAATGSTTDNRITEFKYDKNGRRIEEKRLGVGSWIVNANGALGVGLDDAKIVYSYNALGQVKDKTEANGDVTAYFYDNHGRLSWQQDPWFKDYGQIDVYHGVRMRYDALGNLVQTREQGVDANGFDAAGYDSTTQRITVYTYGAGGRLSSTTDADGITTSYGYDKLGNLLIQSVAHKRSDNTDLTTSSLFTYDAVNRQTRSSQRDVSGTTTNMPWQTIEYNAYGDIWKKGIATSAIAPPVITEQFEYDKAGRVTKSNAGDGVWKFFGYDGNGNATLAITSGGDSLGGYSNLTAAIAQIGVEGVNATHTKFDGRNMAFETFEEGRRLTATGALADIIRNQSYNAFGELKSETDARASAPGHHSYTTEYQYNRMGRLVRKVAPTVKMVEENGAEKWIRPTEEYYYDISGRLVATRDANGSYATGGTEAAGGTIKADNTGNLITRLLLAGTGHAANGDEALVVKEFRPDQSISETLYDAFRDARRLIVGENYAKKANGHTFSQTEQNYDRMGRLTHVRRPYSGDSLLEEFYRYDGLSRRTRSWNNFYGEVEAARTDYDALGRVVFNRAQGGDITTTSYSWDASLQNSALGCYGGWVQTTQFHNTKTSIVKSDAFGRELWKKDLGDHEFTSTYTASGLLYERAAALNNASGVQRYHWFNTGQLKQAETLSGVEIYGYDKAGNRIREVMTAIVNGTSFTVKNATADYDALGRMTFWKEYGDGLLPTPTAETKTSYDANGNIRRMEAKHYQIDAYGNLNGWAPDEDYWYRYDSLNRVVTDRGSLSGTAGAVGTTIARSQSGSKDLYYNKSGDRELIIAIVGNPANSAQRREERERYEYDSAGRMLKAYVTQGAWSSGTPGAAADPTMVTTNLRSAMVYDALGRLTQQYDYGGTTNRVYPNYSYARFITYNAKNQLIADASETIRLREGSSTATDSWMSITRNDYDANGDISDGAGVTYALGAVVWSHTDTYKNGISADSADPDTLTKTEYAWWDGAVQSAVKYDKDHAGNARIANNWSGDIATTQLNTSIVLGGGVDQIDETFTSSFTLNGVGQTTAVNVADGVPKTLSYILDANGQIIRRKEVRTSPPSGVDPNLAPREHYYRFAGKQMGMLGNNGTVDVGYDASITARSAASPAISSSNAGLFRNGTNTGYASYADFSQSIDPYNSSQQGSAAGGSYTVRSGDTLQGIAAALWGDANLWYKLAEANGLSAAASLSAGQSLILPAGVAKNTHNASTFMPYDASEAMGDTLPTTPKPPKKPKCGVFGQIILAVIAQVVTALSTALLLPVLGPAAPVAGAALGSAASQGVGVATGIQPKFSWNAVGMAAVRAGVQVLIGAPQGFDPVTTVVNEAASQGIGIGLRLQKKFDWTGVATAVVSNAVGELKIGGSGFGGQIVRSGADVLARAATRSALSGDSFGLSIKTELPAALASLAVSAARTAFDGKSSRKTDAKAELVETVGNTQEQAAAESAAENGGKVRYINPPGNPIGTEASGMRFMVNPETGELSGTGSVDDAPRSIYGSGGKPLIVWIKDNIANETSRRNFEFSITDDGDNPINVADRLVRESGGNYEWLSETEFRLSEHADGNVNISAVAAQLRQGIPEEYRTIVVTGEQVPTSIGMYDAGISSQTSLVFSLDLTPPPYQLTTKRAPRQGAARSVFQSTTDVMMFNAQANARQGQAMADGLRRGIAATDRALSTPWHAPETGIQPPMSIFDYQSKNPQTYKWALNGKVAIGVTLEVAGLKGATKAGSAAMEMAEELAPRVNVAEKFIAKTRINGIQYTYKNADRGHGLVMFVSKDGTLGLNIRASSAYRESGTDMILSGLQRLKADGVDVERIRGSWFAGSDSVNYSQFVKNMETMNVRDAALNTWTGRLASKLGYTEVIVKDPSSRQVTATFYRKSR